MAAVVVLTLVDDRPEVVRVPEERSEFAVGHLGGGVSAWSAAEPSVVELVRERFECVLAGRVELERDPDQFRSLGIELDGADFVAVEAVDDVAVAEGCSAESAALLGLLPHLVADVGAELRRLILVDRGEYTVHELTDR
ncbi:MAG: hypothetical protein QNJ12_11545 [Ilumatobacter sp.]|nr:hypothetical protein [Ilumatobacter sp.]MDJ0769424.1 hypothetical protein [Ilumatobacter sp.]